MVFLRVKKLQKLKIFKHEWELVSLIMYKQLKIENDKLNANNEKLKLVDGLFELVFNRIFYITRELLLLQKFIFEKGVKTVL